MAKHWKFVLVLDSSRCWAPPAGEAEGILGATKRGKYRWPPWRRGDISAYVSATGTLNPVIMVQVGTQVSGTIENSSPIITHR